MPHCAVPGASSAPAGAPDRAMTRRDQHQLVREEFAKQAPSFGQEGFTLSNRALLDWTVESLDLGASHEVLDVAAGTGHLARAMAPRVRRVVALDLSPEMLREGELTAQLQGLSNIQFEEGAAEQLPYASDLFDRVVSRLSLHHMESPRTVLAEMVRVCRPGGEVAIADIVSSEDKALEAAQNRIERGRDPSHVRALSAGGLQALASSASLRVRHSDKREVEVNVERWFDLARTSTEQRQEILSELMESIAEGDRTGMRPFLRDGEVWFRQTWRLVIGVKQG